MTTRSGFRWSVNEVLALQREFELLGWSIDQIAQKHNRTTNAIIFKLDQEGFADYNELYSNLYNSESDDNSSEISLEYNYDDDDNDSETDYNSENNVYNLSHRVYNLEKIILDININIKNMWSYIKHSNQIGNGLN